MRVRTDEPTYAGPRIWALLPTCAHLILRSALPRVGRSVLGSPPPSHHFLQPALPDALTSGQKLEDGKVAWSICDDRNPYPVVDPLERCFRNQARGGRSNSDPVLA
jgi:hypothetical protein